jgi:hypothetical protein
MAARSIYDEHNSTTFLRGAGRKQRNRGRLIQSWWRRLRSRTSLNKSAQARSRRKAVAKGEEVSCGRRDAGCGVRASREVAEGKFDAELPIDVFQTGSGTSSNMNANRRPGTNGKKLLTSNRFSCIL